MQNAVVAGNLLHGDREGNCTGKWTRPCAQPGDLASFLALPLACCSALPDRSLSLSEPWARPPTPTPDVRGGPWSFLLCLCDRSYFFSRHSLGKI